MATDLELVTAQDVPALVLAEIRLLESQPR
jgi:hypothetical protein